jgi:hypothetical protein
MIKELSEQNDNQTFLKNFRAIDDIDADSIGEKIQKTLERIFPKKEEKETLLEVKSNTINLADLFAFEEKNNLIPERKIQIGDLTVESSLTDNTVRIKFYKDSKRLDSMQIVFPLDEHVSSLKNNKDILNLFSLKGSSIIQQQLQQTESINLLLNPKLHEKTLQERSLHTKEAIVRFIKALPDNEALLLINTAFNKTTPQSLNHYTLVKSQSK